MEKRTCPLENHLPQKPKNSSAPQVDGARRAVLDKAVGDILKRYGEGSIMKLGEAQSMMNVDAISTGSLSLDIALGVGGVPRGRITEIYGPEIIRQNHHLSAHRG